MTDGTISLASMIVEGRAVLGLSTSELGDRLGYSAEAVEGWERGETLPDAGAISALAVALELDARDLADAAGPDLLTNSRAEGTGDDGKAEDTVVQPTVNSSPDSPSDATMPAPDADGDSAHESMTYSSAGPLSGTPDAADAQADAQAEVPASRLADAPGSAEGMDRPEPQAATRVGEPDQGSRVGSREVWTDLEPGSDVPSVGGSVIEAVRSDPEVPEPVRPDAATASGVDPLDWIRRGAIWVRNRWRRRRLLARAPTAVRSYVEDDRQATTYRIRQVLTGVALIALLLILRWAWGQFAEAISTLFDSMRAAV